MPGTIPCPQCGASAHIRKWFWLGSTAGPVEHLKIGSVNNHWLTPLAHTVAGTQPHPSPAARGGGARVSPSRLRYAGTEQRLGPASPRARRWLR